MRWTLFLIALAAAAANAQEQEGIGYKVYGSVGSEFHFTPNNEGSPLNPGGALKIPLPSDSSDVTVFGDVATDDKSWKLHFKLRSSGDWNGDSRARGEVNELYLSWSATPWLDLGIGRKIEKWGTGYGWNPTGVVNPLKDPRDPNDRLDAFHGVDQASIDLFLKGWNVTMMAVPVLPWPGQPDRRATKIGWASRAYRLIHGIDFSVVASGGSGLPNSQGVSASRVFGKALELHAEAAAFHNTVRYVPEAGGFELQRRPHSELLFGGQYTFPHNVNLIVEYYHNGANLSDREWMAFRQFADRGAADLANGNAMTLTVANQQYTALGMGRDYVFNRIAWPIILQKLDFETIAITSLRDRSTVLRPGLYWKVSPNWMVYCLETEFIGRRQSELGYVPIRRETDIGFRFHF